MPVTERHSPHCKNPWVIESTSGCDVAIHSTARPARPITPRPTAHLAPLQTPLAPPPDCPGRPPPDPARACSPSPSPPHCRLHSAGFCWRAGPLLFFNRSQQSARPHRLAQRVGLDPLSLRHFRRRLCVIQAV